MKPTFAFVFHACDAYEPLFKGCIYYFNKYWDKNLPIDKYFITEEKEPTLDGFKIIKSGKGAWTKRLENAIRQIDAEYILYFQEDYWLTQKVDANLFKRIMDVVVELRPPLLKLHNQKDDFYFLPSEQKKINGFTVEKLDTQKSDFLLSHRAAFWQRDFFLEHLKKKESPWQNELFGTERLRGKDVSIYMIDYFRDNDNGRMESGPYSHYYTVAKEGKVNPYITHFIEEMEKGLMEEEDMRTYLLKMKTYFENKTPLVNAKVNLNIWDRARYKIKRLMLPS